MSTGREASRPIKKPRLADRSGAGVKRVGIQHGGTLEATHLEMIAVPCHVVFRVEARLNWMSRATSFNYLVRSGVNP